MAIWWYVTRASGLVAWGLLTFSVVWGLLLSTKVLGRKPSPAWVLDLHRFLGAATVVFTLVHVGGIFADSFVDFGVVEVLVPFASDWDPVGVAWGIVGLYLLLAVEATSLLRRRLTPRIWRRVHSLSLPLFLVATLHGVSAGSDAGTTAAILVGIVSISAVTALLVVRFARSSASPAPRARQSRSPAQRLVVAAAPDERGGGREPVVERLERAQRREEVVVGPPPRRPSPPRPDPQRRLGVRPRAELDLDRHAAGDPRDRDTAPRPAGHDVVVAHRRRVEAERVAWHHVDRAGAQQGIE
jgi:DMSO/TMAO reductase YedYZ heme-binding membrane subunit